MPAVVAKVKEVTGKEPFKGINPDGCVAVGAAVLGGVLTGEVKDVLFLDEIVRLEPGMGICIEHYKAFHDVISQGKITHVDLVYKYLVMGNEKIYFNDIYDLKIIEMYGQDDNDNRPGRCAERTSRHQ